MNSNNKRMLLEDFRSICCKLKKDGIDGDLRSDDKPPQTTTTQTNPNPTPTTPNPTPLITTTQFQTDQTDPDPDLKTQFPFIQPPNSITTFQNKPKIPDAIVDTPIPPNPPDDPNDPNPIPPQPTPPPTLSCPQLHPSNTVPGIKSQFDIVNDITQYINATGNRHDPDGIYWIARSDWIPWDGVTTVNPCTATKAQVQAHVFPKGINTMRGLRELFYSINPFQDNSNPTVSEIENWNIEVIKHFRKLLGYNQNTHPVSNDKCTYLKAAWSDERFRTNYWTTKYPGTLDSANGPCTLPVSRNAHCGGGFMLNPSDQTPYLCPANMQPCTNTSGAEGLSNHNTNIPWSVKLPRLIAMYMASDGLGGHTGPFIGREYFGTSWYMWPDNPRTVTIRTKWSGKNNYIC
jgi:hypothetical protein